MTIFSEKSTKKPVGLTTYTHPLTALQVPVLRTVLAENGFDFFEEKYTIYCAKKAKLSVKVYEKGPKVLVQGKGLEEFLQFLLEPQVLGEVTYGYEEELHPERFAPHFGIDESGKGDFFGPLVIAGTYTDAAMAKKFREWGIADSKLIATDSRIRQLAEKIRRSGAPHRVVFISPQKYNELYGKFRNLNYLLAWGHSRVIEDLCEMVPSCPVALSDQFAKNKNVLASSLLAAGRKLELRQQTKAESDPAVAAASILARERLIDWLENQAKEDGEKSAYPRGASGGVKQRARELVQAKGKEVLGRVAKLHFKTASEVLATTV